MNRAEYLGYRKADQIGEVAYAYYLTKVARPLNREDFKRFFPLFAQAESKKINWQLLWRHYDIVFDVRILTDTKNNNKVIMIF